MVRLGVIAGMSLPGATGGAALLGLAGPGGGLEPNTSGSKGGGGSSFDQGVTIDLVVPYDRVVATTSTRGPSPRIWVSAWTRRW
jgi:hypothetical protein